jgi:non-ribosomal peptide synthetase component F
MTKGKCIHELFEEQVQRNPVAVAVVCEARELSYRDIDGRSNQLAHYLREFGCRSLISGSGANAVLETFGF